MIEIQFRRSNLRWGMHPDRYELDVLEVLKSGIWYTVPNYTSTATDDTRKLAEMQRWASDNNIILV